MMQGKRTTKEAYQLEPGEYCHTRSGWYGMTPNGLLSGLRNHQVVENKDGTVTVSPSILTTMGNDGPSWHGFLRNGVWMEC